jgi:hypothetical protein
MNNNRLSVFMISEEDIEQLVYEWVIVPDWIKAHIRVKAPAHRYDGDLEIGNDDLVFSGRDAKTGRNFELKIAMDDITDVFLGFSRKLGSSIDPGFGIGGPVPFAVTYNTIGKKQTVYFNAGFNDYLIHGEQTNFRWSEKIEEAIAGYKDRKLTSRKLFHLTAV